jgi:hypothetical protein
MDLDLVVAHHLTDVIGSWKNNDVPHYGSRFERKLPDYGRAPWPGFSANEVGSVPVCRETCSAPYSSSSRRDRERRRSGVR